MLLQALIRSPKKEGPKNLILKSQKKKGPQVFIPACWNGCTSPGAVASGLHTKACKFGVPYGLVESLEERIPCLAQL